MATDLFLEMDELPATGSLGTGQLDTRDLLAAGVPISISSKYLYLYLELSGSTRLKQNRSTRNGSLAVLGWYFKNSTLLTFVVSL